MLQLCCGSYEGSKAFCCIRTAELRQERGISHPVTYETVVTLPPATPTAHNKTSCPMPANQAVSLPPPSLLPHLTPDHSTLRATVEAQSKVEAEEREKVRRKLKRSKSGSSFHCQLGGTGQTAGAAPKRASGHKKHPQELQG